MTIEALIAEEAARLNAGDYVGWLELLTDDVRYEVPPPGWPDADPAQVLHLVADDRGRLERRVAQLASDPWGGRARRWVHGVRPTPEGSGWRVAAGAEIRWQGPGAAERYTGELRWRVVETTSGLRIALRRFLLDQRVVGSLRFVL